MTRTITKRSLALMISAVLFLALAFVFTQEANAASGNTIYQPTKITYVYVNDDGSKDKTVTEFTYDKHGLTKQTVRTTGTEVSKSVYSRTKAGAIKSIKTYNKAGKLTGEDKYTYKNGKVYKIKVYTVKPETGKKTLSVTVTYTYKKGKLYKEIYKTEDGVTTSYFYSNGATKKSIYKSKDSKYTYYYNKKGHPTKTESSWTYGNNTTTGVTTYKIKANKKGGILKEVATEKEKSSDGTTRTTVSTTTNKIKYNKAGRVIRYESSHQYKSDDFNYNNSSTTTYKYKKFKVAKKYQKYL